VVHQAARHGELRVAAAQFVDLANGVLALGGGENLRHHLPSLRREDAEPDLLHGVHAAPELQKLPQVARPFHHLAGDGAVDGDALVGDVVQNSFIGGRSAARIVLGFESVHRNRKREAVVGPPDVRHGPEGAGDELNVNAHRQQLGQHQFHFAIAHQGIAAHQRQVQRTQFTDQLHHTAYQLIALEITELAQIDAVAQMLIFKCVATWTTQWTLLGDLDGERGFAPPENQPPSSHNVAGLHLSPLLLQTRPR